MNHSNKTVPTIIPASLNIATLFPDAAILPNRPADPFKEVLIEEKVSFYESVCQPHLSFAHFHISKDRNSKGTYRIINNILRPRIIINVNCNTS